MSPSNRFLSNEDVYGIADAAVSEEAGEIFAGYTPSPSEQVARRYDGRGQQHGSSDSSAGAEVLHAINRDRAREDLTAAPSPLPHASCLDLGEENGERARALVSCTPSESSYADVTAGLVASDLNGAIINSNTSRDDGGDFRVQLNACARLGAQNSVSDMGSGNAQRLVPVAFGVRLGSLDADRSERVESDDGHDYAQKPGANLVVVSDPGVAIPPNEEILEDVRPSLFPLLCFFSSLLPCPGVP